MSILDILKPIHIIAGSLTLIRGLMAMTSQKGKRIQRISGQVFFWSIAVCTLLGLNAGIFRPNYEIFIPIAIISFYQAA